MENKKKNNTILIILLIIFIVSTLSLGGYIIYDKTLSKKDTNNNEVTNNDIDTNQKDIIDNINNQNDNNIKDEDNNNNNNIKEFFEKNYLLSIMKYSEPKNLLKENKQENQSYLLLKLQSSEYADFKLSDIEQTYGITNDNMKKFLKETFNYDYPDNEIKEYFKNSYNLEKDLYLFTISGGIIPPQVESINYQDEKYYITIYLESDHIEKGTVVLKQENNQFYFYSSTGLN